MQRNAISFSYAKRERPLVSPSEALSDECSSVISERKVGIRCAERLKPRTKKRISKSDAVQHKHKAQQSSVIYATC